MNRRFKRYRPLLQAVAAGSIALAGATAMAQQGPSATLPVKQITLFTSGVAYTERGGEVDGNAEVPLTFRTAQINDLLKSMVLLDAGGKVQPATYASRDPVSRSLQAFAVDVSQNLTQADLMARLRGVKIQVNETGKPAIEGQIVGVEQRESPSMVREAKPVTATYLNLLTTAGLVSIKLDTDKTVRVLDERLDREFREALTLLATGADDQRRQVKLHFDGAGKRQVRVGYVMEAPIWKISYRLVLNAEGKPYLQGWALVENATDEDWTGVKLSLVSGRPVSFIQDLYQPLYIPRPVVQPDIVASPFPQTHDEDMGGQKEPARIATLNGPAGKDGVNLLADAPAPSAPAGGPAGATAGFAGGGFGAGGGGRMSGGKSAMLAKGLRNGSMAGEYADVLKQSTEAGASGEKAGELFQYSITTPLTLKRQEAAMIPVIAQDVESEKVSLFNLADGSKFPLNAIRLKNTTGMHLKGGAVTLFDGGIYAGDARMEDVPPGDSRLITYAVDLEMEVAQTGQTQASTETAISIKRGVLVVTTKSQRETEYTVKSKSLKPRTVLIEHPIDPAGKLLQPAKAEEQTATLYRFAVKIDPGKSEKLKVVTERPIEQQFAMLDTDMNLLAFYSRRKELPEKLKTVISEVIQRRAKVQDLKAQAQRKDAEIAAISADQERIRKNMEALDKNSALYKRYVGELDEQETHLAKLRDEAARLRSQATAAEADLKIYIDGITIQ